MKRISLHSSDILGDDAAFHMTRAMLETGRPKALHSHDFFELIWVQNGRLRLHGPDRQTDLSEGDLVFIRPPDLHALQARGSDTFVVSLALSSQLIERLGERHADLAGALFWSKSPTPIKAHRDMRQLADLNKAALRLERAHRSALEAEAFLLPLCASLMDETKEEAEGAPDWLLTACSAAHQPNVFRKGAAGFVSETGRAHAHVSRTAKQFLGVTPSEYINRIRMEYAARRLSGTADQLSEIASDCGIPNLSHFHKCFFARHGITPHQYRRQMQKNVLQPS